MNYLFNKEKNINMIKIENLTKKYETSIANLDITLDIKKGEVFGILGPNGAGKTTLIRQIMGFIKPDSGSVLVNDLNPFTDSKKIMENIGYVSGEISLYDNLKGNDYLDIIFKFRKIDKDFYEKLIMHFDIDINKKIKKMSKGMKQKIALIAAVMPQPEILILDEPTSGLDPVMKLQFNKLILKLKNSGTTVIICSHIMEEISELCTRIGFLKQGKLIEIMDINENNKSKINEKFNNMNERKDFL